MKTYPIETAPRDGSYIMLFGGFAGDDVNPSQPSSQEDLKRPVVATWRPSCEAQGGCWVIAQYDSGIPITYERPKAWAHCPKVKIEKRFCRDCHWFWLEEPGNRQNYCAEHRIEGIVTENDSCDFWQQKRPDCYVEP